MTKTYMGMPVVLDETFDPDRWDLVRTPEGEEFIEVSQKVFDLLQDEHPWCLQCGRGFDDASEDPCWACRPPSQKRSLDLICRDHMRQMLDRFCGPENFGMACLIGVDNDSEGQVVLPEIKCAHRIYHDAVTDNYIAVRPRLDGSYADVGWSLVRHQP